MKKVILALLAPVLVATGITVAAIAMKSESVPTEAETPQAEESQASNELALQFDLNAIEVGTDVTELYAEINAYAKENGEEADLPFLQVGRYLFYTVDAETEAIAVLSPDYKIVEEICKFEKPQTSVATVGTVKEGTDKITLVKLLGNPIGCFTSSETLTFRLDDGTYATAYFGSFADENGGSYLGVSRILMKDVNIKQCLGMTLRKAMETLGVDVIQDRELFEDRSSIEQMPAWNLNETRRVTMEFDVEGCDSEEEVWDKISEATGYSFREEVSVDGRVLRQWIGTEEAMDACTEWLLDHRTVKYICLSERAEDASYKVIEEYRLNP